MASSSASPFGSADTSSTIVLGQVRASPDASWLVDACLVPEEAVSTRRAIGGTSSRAVTATLTDT